MKMNRNSTLKKIIELKKESEELQEVTNYLTRENFDYAVKCNRIENIISHIRTITQDNPRKLMAASDHLFSILQAYGSTNKTVDGIHKPPQLTGQEKSIAQKSEESFATNKKAHVVNPHSINGSVLYIPTINLTRISDIQMQSLKNNNNESYTSEVNSHNSTTLNSFNAENEAEPGSSSSQEHSAADQLSNIDETLDNTPKSPAHSTVLSGTFQEVKIFLNQISSKRRSEETRKSNPKNPHRSSKRNKK